MKHELSKERLEEIAAHEIGSDAYPRRAEWQAMARALLAAHEQEPAQPIWGAAKYPVSRPASGSKLIVWDEVGKFVGYGHAVDTRESGVAIQMNDGRRFDSNYELRWQYALHPAPSIPAAVPKCPKCNGTGLADSGGVQPWGEPILIECDCRAAMLLAAPLQGG